MLVILKIGNYRFRYSSGYFISQLTLLVAVRNHLLVLSGPDGGVCKVQADPPILYPATPSNVPSWSSGAFVFSAASASHLEWGEALRTFHLTSNGGFTFLTSATLASDPTTSSYYRNLATFWDSASDTVFNFNVNPSNGYFGVELAHGGSTSSLASQNALPINTWLVLGFRYLASSNEMSIWVDGVDVSPSGQVLSIVSSVCLVLRPALHGHVNREASTFECLASGTLIYSRMI
jgi:hypothetical protein